MTLIAGRILMTLAVGACVALLPAVAQANHLSCGDVITQDTKLDSDILGCPAKGLTIAADGVTLDLNGHTIAGEQFDEAEEGISSDGYDDLVVRNGTVTDFGQSIVLEKTSNGTVRNINGAFNYGGISISGDHNTVTRSISATSFYALAVHGDDNLISRNVIRSAESAAFVSGTRSAVVGNEIVGRFGGLAVRLIDGLVRDNTVSRAYYGYEISGSNTRFIRNVATNNRLVGFVVGGEGIVLERNLAVEAGSIESAEGTGISVGNPTTTLTRNTANSNGEYGIYVGSTAIDGGRNTASRNGVADCVNIRCR